MTSCRLSGSLNGGLFLSVRVNEISESVTCPEWRHSRGSAFARVTASFQSAMKNADRGVTETEGSGLLLELVFCPFQKCAMRN